MLLQLDTRWTEHICGLPESGMGYHLVDVTLHDGTRVPNVFVFNAQHIDWPPTRGHIQPADIVDITAASRQEA